MLVCLIFGNFRAEAQILNQQMNEDSVQTAFIPALSFKSDLGLLGGAIVNRLDYNDGIKPYRSQQQFAILASTRGFFSFHSYVETIKTLNTNLRSSLELNANRIFQNMYFGIGNEAPFVEDRWNNEFYFFESVRFELMYEGRQPITDLETRKGLDFLFIAQTSYSQPLIELGSRKMGIDQPQGIRGGWINTVGLGFLFENRNDEFTPTAGNRVSGRFTWSPNLLLSDFAMAKFRFEARQFFSFHLLRTVTIANRVILEHNFGDIPYWELAELGGHRELRGYPSNRFLGDQSLSYTLEARTWLFHFDKINSKVGGQLFTDVGRVLHGNENYGDFFRNYKQTFGFGGAATLFNPDVVLRGDIGFSEDMYRIYFGFGYLF